MARPVIRRRILQFPDYWTFAADGAEAGNGTVIMSLDEYETVRLIDHDGMTQEECARSMGVARTTVTAIYERARKKLADLIVEGTTLRVSGGTYQLPEEIIDNIDRKGDSIMRIAVTYENGEVFQHFGHTSEFKIYDAENGQIVNEQVITSGGEGHGKLAGVLKGAGVDALICGGIGGGAKNALAEAGIELYPGVSGNADEAVRALLSSSLQFDPDAKCDHHGEHGHHHEHHGEHCGHEGHGEHCGHGGCEDE